ncbi:unnamed protein product [Larinioides sclopetarius]|uniref:Nuclear pore complex protein Nup153 n=1 Tax=Larinioides sclopetarius TaxID=280406 RepID=A0AAV2AJ56_9ARAC
MDRRVIRSKKNKSRNVRPYDRPNQGILGKVASKVKDLLTPSWIFNVSQWISTPQEQPGSSNTPEEESNDEDEVPPQTTTISTMSSTSHGSKRARLRLHEPGSSILNEGTQAWLDAPSSSNLFNQSPCLPSTVTQNTLVENKESPVIMNGDDHSENSEGSASTSGCSSLVSSHKERSNCIGPSNLRLSESALANLRGTLKNTVDLKNRRDLASQKEGYPSPNTSASRLSLWSGGLSPAAKFHQRSPSVANSSQPSFNVSAFGAPSKVNQQIERRVASPFYQGSTRFGGASATRKIPISTAPYQIEKPSRNQIKVRSNQSEDSLEGMSSAAKRILLTLEKMSSPVTDAKKIPNTNKSPVDLSLYMMPPKHRSNVVSTPGGTSKGPPIANISTISKLMTLKSCGMKKFQNSSMDSLPVPSAEIIKIPADIFQSDLLQTPLAKGGGGKMKSKINQQHESRVGSSSLEQLESVQLPNVPLPISTLPTFSFGPKPDKSCDLITKIGSDFVFSSPIEVLPKVPVHNNISVPHLDSNLQRSSVSQEKQTFTFSNPIEHELPSLILGSVYTPSSSATWECASCWVRNPTNESKCISCETPKPTLNSTEPKLPMASTPSTKPLSDFSSNLTNPPKPSAPISKETSASINTSASVSSWACNECWVNNPAKEVKCLACETPKPGSKVDRASNSTSESSFPTFGISSSGTSGFFSHTLSSSSGGFKLPDIPCDSSDQTVTFGGFKLPAAKPCDSSDQTVRFGGLKLPAAKPSDSEPNKSGVKTSNEIFTSKLPEASKTSPSKNSDLSTLESIAKSVCSSKTSASSTLNGPSKVSFATKKPNNAENTVSEEEKTNSNFSFKTNVTSQSSSVTSFSGKPLPVNNPPGSWECDICMVINTSDKQKCVACETLRPSKTNMSGLKDPESFKFTSPLESSPITFKFISSSTSQTTTTTSTFTFGSSSSATSTFFTPVSSSATSASTTNEPKVVSLTESSTPKPSVPEFKFDAPKVPSLDTSKRNIPVIDLVDEKESTDAKLSSFSTLVSKSSNEGSQVPSITSSSNSAFKITTPVIGNTSLTPSVSTENKLTLPVPVKTDTPEADSKKIESISSGQSKDAPVGGFNFKIPSSATSAFGGFGTSNSNIDNKLASQAKSINAEKKPDPTLGVNVSTPSLSSPFSIPTSTPVFKAGDKVETAIASEASAIKNVFASSVASSSTPTFNFSNTPISLIGLAPTSSGLALASSQPNLSLAPTQTQSFGTMVKSQDLKPVASGVSFSAAATTSTFTFGTPAATTTQSNPSSGFSFFTSSATNATPSTTQSLFMFGNSNASQPSTTSFTFKGLNEDKPAPAPSNALNFNAPATTTSTSSIFKFNASAPTSTGGYVFGAVKSEPGTVSAPSSTFAFGSGSAQSTNSTFSGFQTNPSATPFQFGSQSTANTAPAPTFGSNTNTFSFGKTESTNQLPTTQASSGFAVNTIQPMFGGAAASAFGKTEKAPFNFGMPQGSSTTVFQFGEKKQAIAPQFFGTPAQETPAPAPSFPTSQFNFSTPSSFNFGASTNNSGPFQFAANTADSQSSAPRKIRKAVRRVPRKD